MQESTPIAFEIEQSAPEATVAQEQPSLVATNKRPAESSIVSHEGSQQIHLDKRIKLEV